MPRQVCHSSANLVAPLVFAAATSRDTLKGLTMPQWWYALSRLTPSLQGVAGPARRARRVWGWTCAPLDPASGRAAEQVPHQQAAPLHGHPRGQVGTLRSLSSADRDPGPRLHMALFRRAPYLDRPWARKRCQRVYPWLDPPSMWSTPFTLPS